nr:WYL domain-containing protein [Angustibacter aerolatus]
MSSAKTERLLNLVICLLSTRRPLTKAQIRQSVPQYAEHVSTEAFERMFERDKDEPARPRGTAADHRRGPAVRRRHRLPRRPRGLRPARGEPRAGRAAVLGLASRVWQQASLAGPAARALTKAHRARCTPGRRLADRPRAAHPHQRARVRPVVGRRARPDTGGVRVPHRRPRRAHRAAPRAVGGHQAARPLVRHRPRPRPRRAPRVPPLARRAAGAGHRGGRGYEVPADHDPHAMVEGTVPDRPRTGTTLRVREGTLHAVRRRASDVREDGAGWQRLSLETDDLDMLAEELVAHGPNVVVLEPAEPARRGRAAAAGRADGCRRPRARRDGAGVSESATERLSRLLAMVPWLLSHQGVPVAQAAREFGVPERQR